MKKKNLVIAALMAFSGLLNAQTTEFADKTENPDKIGSWLDFPAEGRNAKNGGGYSVNVDLLDPKPKKVALVSFYLYDPACGKTTGGTYTGSSTASCWRTTNEVAQVQVDGFYNKSIDALKEQFKKYGMDLLTPEEFIDNDEKADFFYNFSQESARKEKSSVTVRKAAGTSISSVAEASVSTLKICPTGKGYRAFFIANEEMTESQVTHFMNTGVMGANRKMSSSLGYELCKGLGVDAVVLCSIVTRKPKMNKENYVVNAVNLYMFGPNPKSEGPEDKNRGQFYCGVRFFSQGMLEFQNAKEGTQSFDHMDNMMKSLGGRLCNYVINKVKKE
jgi:hypothetical protein